MSYLTGDVERYRRYCQYEEPNKTHSEEGLKGLVQSLVENGYREPLIVVRNGGPVVLDGQHRVSFLWYSYGDLTIRVADMLYVHPIPPLL
jgi:hypothetical protein